MAQPKLNVVTATPFAIDTSVPIPPRHHTANSLVTAAVNALSKAEIGASVHFPGVKITAVQQAAYRLGGAGWVTIRKQADGYRAWKIAQPKVRA
jgi:hypothetical protein